MREVREVPMDLRGELKRQSCRVAEASGEAIEGFMRRPPNERTVGAVKDLALMLKEAASAAKIAAGEEDQNGVTVIIGQVVSKAGNAQEAARRLRARREELMTGVIDVTPTPNDGNDANG